MTYDFFINIIFYIAMIVGIISLGLIGAKKEKRSTSITGIDNQKMVIYEINYVLQSSDLIIGRINLMNVSANYRGDEIKVQKEIYELIKKFRTMEEKAITIVEQYKV